MSDTEYIRIEGPSGQLEACYTKMGRAADAGVICHPHPQYGGTMHDLIVSALEKGMHNNDISTVRFNFRGVSGSEGTHDRGVGEMDDVAAVMNWLAETHGIENFWLAGYSFGASVVAHASVGVAAHASVGVVAHTAARGGFNLRQLVLVAPALQFPPDLSELPCPVLVIQGKQDDIVSADQIQQWLAALQSPSDYVEFSDADHFFSAELENIVTALDGRLA